jgi:hypothetical protein
MKGDALILEAPPCCPGAVVCFALAGCVLVSAAGGGFTGLDRRNGGSALRADGTETPLGAGTKDVQMFVHQRMAQQAVAQLAGSASLCCR